MDETNNNEEEGVVKKTGKKRGRRARDAAKEAYKSDRSKVKFVVDLSKDDKTREKVHNLLDELNDKDFGEEIYFKEVAIYAISKLAVKDYEKLKENSLTSEQKLRRYWKESVKKTNSDLSFDDFLLKKLNI